jgi:hypothetical protein
MLKLLRSLATLFLVVALPALADPLGKPTALTAQMICDALGYCPGQGTWYSLGRAPLSSEGRPGDLWLRTDTGDIYKRGTSTWSVIVNVTGASLLNGSGAPSGGTGKDGDFYVDTTAHLLYGPRAAGTWPGSSLLFGQPSGTSVVNPGTGVLEAVLPVQTVSGASKVFTAADFYKKTRRTNGGSGMADTLPDSTATGLVNGTRLNIANVDTTGNLTLAPGAGTSLCSSCGTIVPGRVLLLVWDQPNATWRADANSSSAWSAALDSLAATTNVAYSFLVQTTLGAYEWVAGVTVQTNIAALRANTTPWPTIHVQGFYALADGGGGDFEYDPSDTTSSDDGCTIYVDASSHRYKRTDAKAIDIRQCGAKDDFTAILSSTVTISNGSHALAVSGASFASSDVGKSIAVQGAGAAGGFLATTISAYTSPTQVTLTAAASTGVSGTSNVWYGTNNATALNKATAAAGSRCVLVPAAAHGYLTDDAVSLPNNGCLSGFSRIASTIWVMPTFNLSALGVLVMPTVQPGPAIRNIGLQAVQPDTSTFANLIAYPPAVLGHGASMATIDGFRCLAFLTCIDWRGNMGRTWLNLLELTPMQYGVLVDNSLDLVKIENVNILDFGVTTNQASIFYNDAIGLDFGRADSCFISNVQSLANIAMAFHYSSNWDGTAAYCNIANVNIDQGLGVQLSAGNQTIANLKAGVGNHPNTDGVIALAQGGAVLNAVHVGNGGVSANPIIRMGVVQTCSACKIDNGAGGTGDTLTVGGTTSGYFTAFMQVFGTGVTANTKILRQLTGPSGCTLYSTTYCPPGGAGTYQVSIGQNVGTEAMTARSDGTANLVVSGLFDDNHNSKDNTLISIDGSVTFATFSLGDIVVSQPSGTYNNDVVYIGTASGSLRGVSFTPGGSIGTGKAIHVGSSSSLVSFSNILLNGWSTNIPSGSGIQLWNGPGGQMVQSGVGATSASITANVTFPVPFPNNVTSVTANAQNSGGVNICPANTYNVTTSGFTVSIGSPCGAGTNAFTWHADGY